MRIEQLQYLIEIDKSHSMNATSMKMNITPQALSASVKALENELGVKVMDKSFQGTTLTPLGMSLIHI